MKTRSEVGKATKKISPFMKEDEDNFEKKRNLFL
jgi:hypothetical protein